MHIIIATLPCETLMSAKQAIHDKLQGVVVGLWITELRKVYCWICEWIFLKRWIFGKVTSKSVVVSCTSRAWPTHCEKTKKVYDFDSVELFNCEQVRRTVSCSESSTSARHWRLKSTTTRRGGGRLIRTVDRRLSTEEREHKIRDADKLLLLLATINCDWTCPECRKWRFRFTKTRLAAGLRPNPLGQLTALPQAT